MVNVSFLLKNSRSLIFHVSILRIISMDRILFLVSELYMFISVISSVSWSFSVSKLKKQFKKAFLGYILQKNNKIPLLRCICWLSSYSHCILYSLSFLYKLHGKVMTQFLGFGRRRILMEECVTILQTVLTWKFGCIKPV